MNVRAQIEVLLLTVLIVLVVLSYAIQRFVVFGSFERLERAEATKDLQRGLEAISGEAEHLRRTAQDWAFWDDTYAFAEDRNAAYRESNLIKETFETTGVDLLYFVRTDGEVLYGQCLSPWTGEFVVLPEFPADRWPAGNPLLFREGQERSVAGIVLTGMGPMLLARAHILKGNLEGPPRGAVLMGRFMDEDFRAELAGQTRLNFNYWPVDVAILPPELQGVVRKLEHESAVLLAGSHLDAIDAYGVIKGITGTPALLVGVSFPRAITQQGNVAVLISLMLTMICALVLMTALGFLLRRAVARPIQDLALCMRGIRESDHLSARVPLAVENEIGELAQEFNMLLDRLEKDALEQTRLNQELEALSRQDGLTGLVNRRTFDTVLEREWRRHWRQQLPLSLVLIDVDDFKRYNDTYGHLRGDEVLKRVALVIGGSMRRAGDLPARYGGEEFAAILMESDDRAAERIAEEIRSAIAGLGLLHEHSRAAHMVTVSIGVATLMPSGLHSPNELIRMADLALYQAKDAGRNHVVLFEGEVPANEAPACDTGAAG
ncbi:MAG: diguanylate cyclase [Candidatus Hydrogenedentes bacterium]|nr:diguanylate cyclase [Candidatus Hydrogenedentota bacterium]